VVDRVSKREREGKRKSERERRRKRWVVGRHSFFPVKAATAHGIDCVFLLRAASPPLRQKLCPCRGRAFAA
jgi:hypothetical protein